MRVMTSRWWIYQRERFPLLAHGPLIAVFVASALSFTALGRSPTHFPDPAVATAAFLTVLLFFLELRIADEFKDYEDDLHYRPYRPVPRGLVTLGELGVVGAASALVQLGLAIWMSSSLAPLLALVWAYVSLMAAEFFVRDWLKAHPMAYMLSHLPIVPLIYFYVTAGDWYIAGTPPPRGLVWALAASFATGAVVEIGRKSVV